MECSKKIAVVDATGAAAVIAEAGVVALTGVEYLLRELLQHPGLYTALFYVVLLNLLNNIFTVRK